jgi:hypothetical protein
LAAPDRTPSSATFCAIESSVAYKIVGVALWVAIGAALYSLWFGAAWPEAVFITIFIVGLTLGVRWVGERRRDG